MADRPTHTAYVVEDAPQGSDRKAKWREIGAVWPHKKGGGFDLVLFSQLSVSGRVVCMPREDEKPLEAALNAVEEPSSYAPDEGNHG